MEVIAVDDGSLDSSGELSDELTLLNEELIVVHQSNKWLGGARNTGLDLANGEYVSFVDSDDWLPEGAYSRMVSFAREKQCQVVQFGNFSTDVNGEILGSYVPSVIEAEKNYSQNEIREKIFPILIRSHLINGAPFRLYRFGINGMGRHSNCAQFRFREELRYAEDYVSCLDWFPQYESFVLLGEALYCYRTNPDSIMHAYNPRRIRQLITLYEIREQFMVEQGLLNEECRCQSANLLMKLVLDQLLILVAVPTVAFSQKLRELRMICNDEHISEATGRLMNVKLTEWGRLGQLSLKAIHSTRPFLLYLLLILQHCTKK